MTSRQIILFILLPILLLALGLRLIGIEKPLFEREPSAWRQIHTESTIQGYLHHGFKFFYPEVDFLGNPGYCAVEFPLYQYIVAGLYKFFGEKVIWGRLLTVAASLGSVIYLYFILRKYWGEAAAAAGSLYLAVVPLSVYYGRTVMVDTPVLFLCLGFTYHFLGYLEEGRRGSYLWALVLVLPALLIKVTIGMVFFLPLLILPWLRNKKNIYKRWQFYLFLILPLLLVYLWKSYADNLNQKYAPFTIEPTTQVLAYQIFGPWQMRLDPDFYHLLFLRMVYQILTWPGVILLGVGIILSLCKKNSRVLILYLFSALGYLMIFTPLNYIHDYYQLPLLPVFAAFLGLSVDFVQEKIKNFTLKNNPAAGKILTMVLVVFWGVLLLIPSWGEVRKYSRVVDYQLMYTGWQIGQLMPPGALVVAVTFDERPLPNYPQQVVANTQPKTLYAVGHRGWNLNFSRFTLSKVERLKQDGAQFLVMDLIISYPQEAMWRSMIIEALRKNYREIFTRDRFLVFDLNQPPSPLSPGTPH